MLHCLMVHLTDRWLCGWCKADLLACCVHKKITWCRVLFETLQGICSVYLLLSSLRGKYDAIFFKPVHLNSILNKCSTWHVSEENKSAIQLWPAYTVSWISSFCLSCNLHSNSVFTSSVYIPFPFRQLEKPENSLCEKAAEIGSTKAIPLSVYIPSRKSELAQHIQQWSWGHAMAAQGPGGICWSLSLDLRDGDSEQSCWLVLLMDLCHHTLLSMQIWKYASVHIYMQL